MSVVFSGTLQGTFVSTGNPQTIQLPTGVDWMRVYNLTTSYADGAGTGAEFYWQLGMTQGQGTIYTKTSATNALTVGQIAAGAGFYLVNNTINIPGASIATGAITGGKPNSVACNPTAGITAGSVVRMYTQTGATQLNALDFTVGTVTTNTSFTLAYMAPIVTSSGPGAVRVIPYDPYFYPPYRYICAISADANNNAIVSMTVTHNYTIGQHVRIYVPMVDATYYGMTQLNAVEANIVNINDTDANGFTNTVTLDVNISGFSAFAFPLTGSAGFTPSMIVPMGESTATALDLTTAAQLYTTPPTTYNILSDATINNGYFGMTLQAGTGSPAGVSTNSIYWVAGKSFSGGA